MRQFKHIIKSYIRPSKWAMLMLSTALMVSCSDDPTGDDNTGTEDRPLNEIATWMDSRLKKEYYWMDEYIEKHAQFDLTLEWDKFLNNTLKKLSTNLDDGRVYADGTRHFYSYIYRQESVTASSSSRSSLPTENGYGFELAPYAVIMSNLEGYNDNDRVCFIEHTYPGSAAAEAGLLRGDIILQVNGKKMSAQTFSNIWEELQYGTSGSVKITARSYNKELEKYEAKEYELTTSAFERNPVAFSDILQLPEEFDDEGKKIGYMSYLSFDKNYDEALVDAMADLSQKGVTDMILDLRANSGGDVTSSILLASMLMDESYVGPGKVYARLVHNPSNKIYKDTEHTLQLKYTPEGASEAVDLPNIGIKKLWVICSENTASASEMVIVGLRGLDVEVTLIGTTTEGKNCGMEVSYKTHDGYKYEFAPITFMSENGKGFNDYGDGIVPDIDLIAMAEKPSLDKDLISFCHNYPLPYTTWGNIDNDIALAEVVMQIYGKTLFTPSTKAVMPHQATTRAEGSVTFELTSLKMEKKGLSARGLIVYPDEE